jgi:hypothetical protein
VRRNEDEGAWWALLAVSGGGAVVCLVGLATFEVTAQDEHPVHLREGWPLAVLVVLVICTLAFGWIFVGQVTRLWNLPLIQEGGVSYWTRVRKWRPTRGRGSSFFNNVLISGAVSMIRRELRYNRSLVGLALAQGAFWQEDQDLRSTAWGDRAAYLSGTEGVVREFRARAEDAYWLLRKPHAAVRAGRYRSPLSSQDIIDLTNALHALDEALAIDVEALENYFLRVLEERRRDRAS